MTPFRREVAASGQVCGCACSMMRSVSGRTKTIRSRIGSKGIVITSTMTKSSRTSAMQPRDSAGARSTASVNSTTSPIATSSIVAIPSSVGLGIGGYQPRRRTFVRVVPCGENRGESPIDGYVDKDAIAGGNPFAATARHWRREYGLGNAIPNPLRVLSRNMKNTSPFGSMSFCSKDPLQLDPLVPGVLGAGEGLSDSRWPGHATEARKRRRACVSRRSIFCGGNCVEVGQAR